MIPKRLRILGLRPMLIESLGLSGSGKTTLAKACQKRLDRMGVDCVDVDALDKLDRKTGAGMPVLWRQERMRQAFHIAGFSQKHPDCTAIFGRLYAANPRNLGIVTAVGGDVMKAQRLLDRYSHFWADEGFLHYGIHAVLTYEQNPEDALVQLWNAIPWPDAILCTVTEPDVAIAGLRKRMTEKGRSPQQTEDRINSVFGGFAHLTQRAKFIDQTLQAGRDRGVCVVTVPAHGNLETMTDLALEGLGVS